MPAFREAPGLVQKYCSRDVKASIEFYISRLGFELAFEECRDQVIFHEDTALRDSESGTREFAFFDPDSNGLTFYCDREQP